MIQVLVVGGSVTSRTRVAAELAGDDRLEVVAQARAEPPVHLRSAGPDVVVAVVNPDDEGATSALLGLAAEAGAPAVVAVVAHERRAWIAEALQAGVRAVIADDAGTQALRAAVAAAAAGLVVVPSDVSVRVATPSRNRAGAIPTPLTPRELQVLDLLGEGLGNKAIAARLAISERTVKFHVRAIFEKLDVESRTEAVTAALKRGLILL